MIFVFVVFCKTIYVIPFILRLVPLAAAVLGATTTHGVAAGGGAAVVAGAAGAASAALREKWSQLRGKKTQQKGEKSETSLSEADFLADETNERNDNSQTNSPHLAVKKLTQRVRFTGPPIMFSQRGDGPTGGLIVRRTQQTLSPSQQASLMGTTLLELPSEFLRSLAGLSSPDAVQESLFKLAFKDADDARLFFHGVSWLSQSKNAFLRTAVSRSVLLAGCVQFASLLVGTTAAVGALSPAALAGAAFASALSKVAQKVQTAQTQQSFLHESLDLQELSIAIELKAETSDCVNTCRRILEESQAVADLPAQRALFETRIMRLEERVHKLFTVVEAWIEEHRHTLESTTSPHNYRDLERLAQHFRFHYSVMLHAQKASVFLEHLKGFLYAQCREEGLRSLAETRFFGSLRDLGATSDRLDQIAILLSNRCDQTAASIKSKVDAFFDKSFDSAKIAKEFADWTTWQKREIDTARSIYDSPAADDQELHDGMIDDEDEAELFGFYLIVDPKSGQGFLSYIPHSCDSHAD